MLAIFVAACENHPITFVCQADAQCTLNARPGICVDTHPANGVCALQDGTCASGYRYDVTAGDSASKCFVFADGSINPPDMVTPPPEDMTLLPDMTVVPPDMAGPLPDLAGTPALTWSAQASGTTTELNGGFASGASAWAVGQNTIRNTTNTGGTWTPQTTGGTGTQIFYNAWGVSTNELWIVGITSSTSNVATIYHSTNGGGIWNGQAAGTTTFGGSLRSIGGTSSSEIYAVGDSSKVFKTGNSGANWDEKTAVSPATTLEGVFAAGSSVVYAVGRAGHIYKSTDGAATAWASQTPTTSNFYEVWGATALDVWAVGAGGMVYHTTDGQTWGSVTTGVSSDLLGVWGSGANDVFIVGAGGIILHYYNGTLHREDGGTTANLNAVFGSGVGNVYAVGAGGVILHGQ